MFQTAEMVSSGHPDKVADQISDAIVDAYMEQDQESRVAVETMVGHNLIMVSGEITSEADVDIRSVIKAKVASIGYSPTDSVAAFSERSEIRLNIMTQSVGIRDNLKDGGASDQGTVYGYACKDEDSLPPAYRAARDLMRLSEIQNKGHGLLGPDGKYQVTMRNGEAVAVAMSHCVRKAEKQGMAKIKLHNIASAMFEGQRPAVFVNPPNGVFLLGGPSFDAGLTGRKLAVDSYGGLALHGGAFSGKSPEKIDRCGAYMARYLAKIAQEASGADDVTVGLSYIFGIPHPVMYSIRTTEGAVMQNWLDQYLNDDLKKNYSCTVENIEETLQLHKMSSMHGGNYFQRLATGGHFGRHDLEKDMYMPWERTNRC